MNSPYFKLAFILFFTTLLFAGKTSGAQSKSNIDLSTPLKSLAVLSKALKTRDTLVLQKISTREGYNAIITRNLFSYAEKWILLIKKKEITTFHDSARLEILKPGAEDYLLSFSLGKGEWKFTAFITQP